MLDALARQVGTAIQRNRSIELLRDIGTQINSAQEISEILQLIVKGAIDLLQTTSGVIYLISPDGLAIKDTRRFTPTEVALLETLGNQAATAIYKAELMHSLEVQAMRQGVLNQIGADLVGLQDAAKILDAVAQAAQRTLMASHTSVFEVVGDQIVVRAARGNRSHFLQPGCSFRFGQGLAGWVAETDIAVINLKQWRSRALTFGWFNIQ